MSLTINSPIHVAPVDRETAFSLMSRMAAVGGTSAADFGLDHETQFQAILDGKAGAVNRLAQIGGINPAELISWTPQKSKGARRIIRNDTFPSKTILAPEIRGCPVCLQEDAKNASSSPHAAMAIRGDWLIPHVTCCLRHEHALIPLWQEPRQFPRYDTVEQFAKIAPSIICGDFANDFRDPTDFDEWVEARLMGGDVDTWLDQFPLNAASSFCRLLGCALMKRENILLSNVAPGSQWAFYQIGFEVAREGVGAINDALHELNRFAEPKQGPKAVYPLLHDRLAYDYSADADYTPFRDLLSAHIQATWPLGLGDEILGEPVTKRHLHSVQTAAKEYGVDARRLRKMLEADGLVDKELPDAWAVFDAESAQLSLSAMVEFVTAKDFWESINLSRSQFDLLVEDKLLQPSLNHASTKHIWDPREGQAFIDRTLNGAIALQQAQHGWEHIAKTAQRLKIRPADIIRAIWEGKIQSVGKSVQFEGYRAIHVYYDEVATALGGETPAEMSIEVFSKGVGLSDPACMGRLVKFGHTPSTEMQNPKTKALQNYISKADAEEFHAKFVTLRTLAKTHGASWQKMSGELREKGIAPFSPDGRNYGNLYSKSDADAALV